VKPTSSSGLPNGKRIRGIPSFAILVATLGVVSALAFQAYRAEQDQHATAERALREYAGFAAWKFASNAREELWLSMTELLRPAQQLSPTRIGEALPSPTLLVLQNRRIAHCKQCAYVIPASYYFRLDLNDSALTTTLAEGPEARAPEAPERRWIRDTITGHAHGMFRADWRVAAVVGSVDGRRLTLAYTIVRDTAGRLVAAYGVVSESNRFVAAYSAKLGLWDLLPPALIKQTGTKNLVSIVVRDEQKNIVYRSPKQFADRYSATYELEKFATGFVVQASLDPKAAHKLVFGATSRFPLLMTLLVLTAALVGIAFRQLRREAALARLRADFVSSVSHELRTPLAQIRMFAELLRMGWIRSEQERTRSLEIIDQEARRLGHLVDKVLSFESAERGANPLMAEPTALGALIREVLEAFAPLAKARRVSLRLELDDSVVAIVDRGAMRQVLINVLDNAVKYGPAGQTITVGLEAVEQGPWARITVEDEGPGVPAEQRATIWEPFRRLDRDSNSAVAGSGIGLSVVRKLVAGHGGRVAVAEGMVGGARFVIELPRQIPEGTPQAPAGPASSSPIAAGLTSTAGDPVGAR
jgi:signal transduction histidine kinase